MRLFVRAIALSVGLCSLAVLAGPAHAGPHYYGGPRYYGHPRYYYGHPRYYYGHGHCYSFGFAFGAVYAPPPPVYVVPPPVVYYAPPVVVPPPVVVQPPVVVPPPVTAQPAPAQPPCEPAQPGYEGSQPPPNGVEQAPPAQPHPSFVETRRRFHEHGDNAGKLDYVEGLLDGRPVRIYYDDFGQVKKQKWID